MPASSRRGTCGKTEARVRFSAACAYVEVAELVLVEPTRGEFLNVSAGLAVLAGIAASDSICCIRIGQIHRGQDHKDAAELLSGAVIDGKSLAQTLRRLLDMKDAAHYGVVFVAPMNARNAVKWARRLVERAGEELER
jgi:hypothetical protein